MVTVTIRFGHLDDPRITKNAEGRWVAEGIPGSYTTKLPLLDALFDKDHRNGNQADQGEATRPTKR
ncbi:MAG: hypothetical protein ABL901_18670 [Hyphomicrobiaceae bacterium]|nr:hypothetical protein [Hyphomicrobiaceae bacterium]